jgi:hypothetical protein
MRFYSYGTCPPFSLSRNFLNARPPAPLIRSWKTILVLLGRGRKIRFRCNLNEALRGRHSACNYLTILVSLLIDFPAMGRTGFMRV